MNANRNKYVNLKSDTTINDTNCDDDTIVLPSVKKIATLFQDDKNKHPNKSNNRNFKERNMAQPLKEFI